MTALVAASVATAVAAGCQLLPGTGGAAAVWTLAPDQRIDARTTDVRVLVSRLGCNSGVTGEVVEPEVDLDEDRVVLTFTVTPGEPAAADCPGNEPVPYEAALGEPVGDRPLVDGQCLSGGEAVGTSACTADGVRHPG